MILSFDATLTELLTLLLNSFQISFGSENKATFFFPLVYLEEKLRKFRIYNKNYNFERHKTEKVHITDFWCRMNINHFNTDVSLYV